MNSRNLRRHHHQFAAATQHLHLGITQDAEAFVGADVVRRIAVGREAIFAQTEEGEIVGAQPLQELVGFGDLVDRQRRRIGAEAHDRLLDTGSHGLPVADAGAHVVERLGKAVDQLLAVGTGIETGDVQMDQAFAFAPCPFRKRFAVATQKLALLVALYRNDRMGDQRDFDALLGEFRHGRIEQEGHVVVENFEHGNLAPVRHHWIDHADIGTARGASLHMFPGLFCQEGQARGIVVGEILDIGVAEQKLGKSPGDLARLDASRCIADQGCTGLVVTPRRHNVLHSRAIRPQSRSSA